MVLCASSLVRASVPLSQVSLVILTAKLRPCTIKCSDEQFRAEAENWANPLIMRLGEGQQAAKCMTFVGQDQLWCGCGNTIIVVDSNELNVLHHCEENGPG